MKRLFNMMLATVFLLGMLLLSDMADAHLNKAQAAFDRISALASR